MTAAILAVQGTDDGGVRVALHWTARTSLILFVAAFVASSVNRLWRGGAVGKWLLRNRRGLGVSFAVSHVIHLGLIATRMTAHADDFWETRTVASMIPGMTAYAFTALLALTSFDGAVRWLGRKRWKALHKTGVYVIAAVFLGAYLGQAKSHPGYYAAVGLLAGALLLRLVARLSVMRRRRAAPA
jgi:DMSO/TMAO reductase YedYZ heme-binding membrane subunit